MYEIHLEEEEVINYNKIVRAEIEGKILTIGLVVTNLYFEVYQDAHKSIEFMELFRIARGTSNLPRYELVMKENISDIVSSYDGEHTRIKVKGREILILQEKVPLPIL